MVVELQGVWLLATPRDEADWEEGPARKRAKAARDSEIAAAEVGKLSRGPADKEHKAGFGWSFLSHLGVVLLNRLQFSVKDVHFSFRESSAVKYL